MERNSLRWFLGGPKWLLIILTEKALTLSCIKDDKIIISTLYWAPISRQVLYLSHLTCIAVLLIIIISSTLGMSMWLPLDKHERQSLNLELETFPATHSVVSFKRINLWNCFVSSKVPWYFIVRAFLFCKVWPKFKTELCSARWHKPGFHYHSLSVLHLHHLIYLSEPQLSAFGKWWWS